LPTHGALTKAGKVRSQTPNIERTSTKGKSLIPRRNNQSKYMKRIVNNREPAWRRRRRRR